MSVTQPKWVGSAEAAATLGVSIKTITRWAADSAKLEPVAKLPGIRGAFLFARDDIDKLAKERAS